MAAPPTMQTCFGFSRRRRFFCRVVKDPDIKASLGDRRHSLEAVVAERPATWKEGKLCNGRIASKGFWRVCAWLQLPGVSPDTSRVGHGMVNTNRVRDHSLAVIACD